MSRNGIFSTFQYCDQTALQVVFRDLGRQVLLQRAIPVSTNNQRIPRNQQAIDALDNNSSWKFRYGTESGQEPSFLGPSSQSQKHRFGVEDRRNLQRISNHTARHKRQSIAYEHTSSSVKYSFSHVELCGSSSVHQTRLDGPITGCGETTDLEQSKPQPWPLAQRGQYHPEGIPERTSSRSHYRQELELECDS